MINSLKNTTIISLVISLLFGLFTVTNVNAMETVINEDNILTINNDDLGYSGVLETIYNDETIHKYRLTEFGESCILIFDLENDNVLINEHQISFDEYINLTKEQVNGLKRRLSDDSLSILTLAESYPENKNILLEYEEKHLDYVEKAKNHFHDTNLNSRCTTCSLNTTTVPTSNYKSTEYDVGSKSTKMEVALTGTAIAAFAAYCTWGLSAVASAVISGFLEFVGITVAFAQVDYHAYQSFHNICYKAVRERRKIWVQDTDSGKFKETNKYHYFYNSKPY